MATDDAATRSSRWELGSDFHYPGTPSASSSPLDAFPKGMSLWHSGRDALRALVALHPEKFRRVFFPSFYCQDVPLALVADGAEVLVYPDDGVALEVPAGLRPGDAVIVSNTLGLRGASPIIRPLPSGTTLVEDHTHDPFSPWATRMEGDFAFASLRKWLPIPDGGAVWSGRLPVPEPPLLDSSHAHTSLLRLSGMLLKSRYLAGEPVDKATFRELLVSAEHRIGRGDIGAISPIARDLLKLLPAAEYRLARRANFEHCRRTLGDVPELQVLAPLGAEASQAVPFALTVLLPSKAKRDTLRAALAAESIYAAVLWPIDGAALPGIPPEHASRSECILSVHCDARYGQDDMTRLAETLSRLARAS